MPMQWNEQADAKLFANVLKLHVVKLDYQALAKAMGETVTPKAISHRISKIKEKAQVRRLDWERYGNSPTSCTPRKRGSKVKAIDDEEEVSKKRIKLEDTEIKIEENTYDNDHENPVSESIGGYFWSNGWTPDTIAGKFQEHYEPYESEERNINGITDVDYGNVGVNCTGVVSGNNTGAHVDCSSVTISCEGVSV